jgi:Flp pilus assembly secretin CpaC
VSQKSIDCSLAENTQHLISKRIRALMKQSDPATLITEEVKHAVPNQTEIAIQAALKKMLENSDVNQSLESEAKDGLANQAKQYVRKLLRPMFTFQTAHNRANAELSSEIINLINYNERQQTNLYLRSVRHFEEKLGLLLSSIECLEGELQSRDTLITDLKARIQNLESQKTNENAEHRD